MDEAPWVKMDRLIEGDEEKLIKGLYEIIEEGEKKAKEKGWGVAHAYAFTEVYSYKDNKNKENRNIYNESSFDIAKYYSQDNSSIQKIYKLLIEYKKSEVDNNKNGLLSIVVPEEKKGALSVSDYPDYVKLSVVE